MNNKATVLNCRVDLVDTASTLDMCKEAIENNESFHIITINPEMIMNAQKNESFLNIINNSSLNVIDGIGVKIALKFQNINAINVRGVDLSRKLLDLAASNGYRVAFLGAKEEVIVKAIENVKTLRPTLNVVYSRNGYFKDQEEIIEQISMARPQILLVGLGSPFQEEFIVKLKQKLDGCVMVGVGGSFDVFSGIVEEAPIIYRKLGLEWLYRTIKQPERFKRIFPLLPMFLIKCIINSKKG